MAVLVSIGFCPENCLPYWYDIQELAFGPNIGTTRFMDGEVTAVNAPSDIDFWNGVLDFP